MISALIDTEELPLRVTVPKPDSTVIPRITERNETPMAGAANAEPGVVTAEITGDATTRMRRTRSPRRRRGSLRFPQTRAEGDMIPEMRRPTLLNVTTRCLRFSRRREMRGMPTC
mgnify:FL=1